MSAGHNHIQLMMFTAISSVGLVRPRAVAQPSLTSRKFPDQSASGSHDPRPKVQTLNKPSTSEGDGAYERPADAFLSGSMSECVEKGFVRNAMHPESSAALRTAGSSFPVM